MHALSETCLCMSLHLSQYLHLQYTYHARVCVHRPLTEPLPDLVLCRTYSGCEGRNPYSVIPSPCCLCAARLCVVWHERDHEGGNGETTGRETPCSKPSCDTNAHVSLSKPSSQRKPLPHTSLFLLLLPIQFSRTSVPHTCLLLCLFPVT